MEERTRQLVEANKQLEVLSYTDALTQLPNRRCAIQTLKELWNDASLADAPLVCIMIDADYFKQVNDSCGHEAGDVVLKELSHTLKHSFRSDDIVCRLGGDEFLVICPNTDLAGCLLYRSPSHDVRDFFELNSCVTIRSLTDGLS